MLTTIPSVRRADGASPQCAILIPTLNEAENIDSLLGRILTIVEANDIDAEILVVDGGSVDGTPSLVCKWSAGHPVRLVASDARRGLAGDILRGAEAASAEIVVVMDADLSHPPEAIPSLVRPLIVGTHDMAIGSRYVEGGQTPGWPWARRLTSKAATALAWPLVSVRDPMSGFFAMRREQMLDLGREATGFKIALEVLVRGDDMLRVREVPIVFHDRERGQSKLGLNETLTCLKQMFMLAGGAVSVGHTFRFALVGVLGMIVDLLIFNLFLSIDVDFVPSHLASFAAATLFNYSFNARWVFAGTARIGGQVGLWRYTRFLVVCLLALFLRGAVLSALVEAAHWPPQAAILAAIAAAAAVNFVGSAFFVFPQAIARVTPTIRWRVFAMCVVGYVILLRLTFAGVIDLIPEEAYYWVYAQHLDIGYLDHPPMVSWLIWLGTWLFGKSEIGVRLPALACWIITAAFMFRLSMNLYGKTAAFCTLMLVAALPIYFGVGLLMTPDAPLYAAWAGCLYFFERALLAENRRAWWGVGVCLGLGMLSKYTIALMGPAALSFALIDRRSRRWFTRPEPYLAVATAMLFFSPVILWNVTHEWTSFTFQGARRWSGESEFSLHVLVGSAMMLLTPIGLVGVIVSLLPRWGAERSLLSGDERPRDSRKLFTLVFTLTPLLVFLLHSLQNDPKLNWTGPVWLAAIPLLALNMTPKRGRAAPWRAPFGQSLWRPTLVTMLLIYGGGMYYILLGLPGVSPKARMSLPIAWEEMACAIEEIDTQLKTEDGEEPIIVGMDKYFISSQHAFYDPKHDGLEETSGRHLFGENSLMWAYWKPMAAAFGKDVVLIAFNHKNLLSAAIDGSFARISGIATQPVEKKGRVVGYFYYRIGYGYRNSKPSIAHGKFVLNTQGAGA